MAKKKYYAVRIGRKTGIYDSWDECRRQVTGFKGASFKGFESMDDALSFMELGAESASTLSLNPEEINNSVEERIKNLKENELIAFVDGSFDVKKKRSGSGVVIIDASGNEETWCRGFDVSDGESFVALRNVAGELSGARYAVSRAIERGAKSITIYYDYAGIEKWVTGEWKTNLDTTEEYAAWMNVAKNKTDIIFVKVPAHTGVSYNETADTLAKQGIREISANS